MGKRGEIALLLLDNYAGHKVDVSELHNVKIEFFMPNVTGYMQPADCSLYQTTKARARAYRRRYQVENAFKVPSVSELMTEITKIYLNMDPELVKTYWKIAGLIEPNHGEAEKQNELSIEQIQIGDDETEESMIFLSEANRVETDSDTTELTQSQFPIASDSDDDVETVSVPTKKHYMTDYFSTK